VTPWENPEASLTNKPKPVEAHAGLRDVRHDDIDVRGEMGTGRPVRDGEPTDDDRMKADRRERFLDVAAISSICPV